MCEEVVEAGLPRAGGQGRPAAECDWHRDRLVPVGAPEAPLVVINDHHTPRTLEIELEVPRCEALIPHHPPKANKLALKSLEALRII